MFLFAAEGGHHTPLIVDFINHYLGEPVHRFQMNYTRPIWDAILIPFGTTPEALFGEYTPETAIPWYTIMFIIACILTMVVVWIFKGKLSAEDPSNGQLTLEAGVLALRDLVVSVIGEHGFKYFPRRRDVCCAGFDFQLDGTFSAVYVADGFNQRYSRARHRVICLLQLRRHQRKRLVNHLAHLTGPRMPLLLMLFVTPLIFMIELFSNMIRPVTLGIRLFANMFADEQIAMIISGLFPPYTQVLVPAVLLPLALFIALVQTLVFTLLSMIYISEVSHAPHDHTHGGVHSETTGEAIATAHV
jgi:F-type H+-transporting ATPase subunit a